MGGGEPQQVTWRCRRGAVQRAGCAVLPGRRVRQLPVPATRSPATRVCICIFTPQVCEQRGLVREMVFVLGRMGSAEKALRLIVEGLRDVAQVGVGCGKRKWEGSAEQALDLLIVEGLSNVAQVGLTVGRVVELGWVANAVRKELSLAAVHPLY